MRSSQARVAVAAWAFTGITLGCTAAALGSPEVHNGVTVETVSNYDAGGCVGAVDLPNSDPSGSGFLSGMTQNIDDHFVKQAQWQDGLVWPTDFQDPNLSGAPTCPPTCPALDDTDNFDVAGVAVTFFQGHGLQWPKPPFDQLCTSQAQCVTPPSGTANGVGSTGFGTCSQSPASELEYGQGFGICQWKDARALVTCKEGTTSTQDVFINTFGGTTSFMALGETPYIGAWRGAATNGGAALAVVKMSFGMMTFYPSEWLSLFGGLHIYAGVMVSYGDSEDALDFGPQVALAYTSNPNGSVAQGYVNSINGLTSTNDGTGCYTNGLPGGFNGCGCHVAMTVGGASSYSNSPMTEAWSQLKTDDVTQNGGGAWYFTMVCNYNPSTYPWQGGDLYFTTNE